MSLTETQRAGYLGVDEAPLPDSQKVAGLLLPRMSRCGTLEAEGGSSEEQRAEGRKTTGTGPRQELTSASDFNQLDPLLARFIDECIVPLVVKVLRAEEGF